jgi:hypothetical protein
MSDTLCAKRSNALRVLGFSNPKVYQDSLVIRGNNDVIRLDVAVDDWRLPAV